MVGVKAHKQGKRYYGHRVKRRFHGNRYTKNATSMSLEQKSDLSTYEKKIQKKLRDAARYQRRKADPELAALMKLKEKESYRRKKENGQRKPVSEMSAEELKAMREVWRKGSKIRRQKKNIEKALEDNKINITLDAMQWRNLPPQPPPLPSGSSSRQPFAGWIRADPKPESRVDSTPSDDHNYFLEGREEDIQLEELEMKYSQTDSFQSFNKQEISQSYSAGTSLNASRPQTEDPLFSEENEFDAFCQSLAVQLKTMPLHRAHRCQQKIQSFMIEERIKHLEEDSQTPS